MNGSLAWGLMLISLNLVLTLLIFKSKKYEYSSGDPEPILTPDLSDMWMILDILIFLVASLALSYGIFGGDAK